MHSSFKKSIFICLLFINPIFIFAQSLNWQFGNNITTYKYTNATGTPLSYLKSSAGLNMALGMEFALLDTNKFLTDLKAPSQTKLVAENPSGSISNFYIKNHKLASLLSIIHTEFGFTYNQWNAVGNTQNIILTYQTDFVGLYAGIGPTIKLPKDFQISLSGRGYMAKMIHGNQQNNNEFLDLMDYTAFSKVQIMLGYQVSIIKKISNKMAGFLNYQSMQGFNSGAGSLNFQPATLAIGIKISK